MGLIHTNRNATIIGIDGQVWGAPMRGLSNERRVAIHMVCRVVAYSAMRPIEVIRLETQDVTDEWIKISRSKTPTSHRTIPLPVLLAEGDQQDTYHLLQIWDVVDCFDEQNSIFETFSVNDPVFADRAGDYCSVTKLVVDAARTGARHFFELHD